MMIIEIHDPLGCFSPHFPAAPDPPLCPVISACGLHSGCSAGVIFGPVFTPPRALRNTKKNIEFRILQNEPRRGSSSQRGPSDRSKIALV
jgi:hypothetical protein